MQDDPTQPQGDILAQCGLFKGLAPHDLDIIVRAGMFLDAKSGALVLYENVRGGFGLYLILAGRVDVVRLHSEDPDGGESRIATLGPGNCLGEYSLIDGQHTSAAARAVDDCRLFFLPRAAFQNLMKADQAIGNRISQNLLVYLVSRLRAVTP